MCKCISVFSPYNTIDAIRQLMERDELIDIWRVRHPHRKMFTWASKRGGKLTWSRLDFFLISTSLANLCKSYKILPCILTDHSLVTLSLDTSASERGPGFWKLNDLLLEDDVYCNLICRTIVETERKFNHLDSIQLWELIKHEIIRISMEVSKQKAYDRNRKKFNLFKLLECMQSDWINNPEDEFLARNISQVENEIASHHERETKSCAF